MVAPIQGPFVGGSYNNVVGTGSEVRGWVRYRQKAPYNLPLKYKWNIRRILFAKHVGPGDPNDPAMFRASISGTTSVVAISPDHPEVQTKIVQATNKAYSDFVSQVSLAQAGLGETFAQYPQAVQMIAERVTTLAKTAALIRRRRFKLAWQTLGLKPPQGWRAKSKTFGGLWLEYHFGWEPLVKDIYNSASFLSASYGLPVVKGRASIKQDIVFDTTSGTSDRIHQRGVHHLEVHAHIQAQLRVTNSNLFLASRLGLINPVSVAWEIVPFSFVVDWFANVGQFIEQFSQFQGCKLLNPCYSYCVTDTCEGTFEEFYPYPKLYYRENGVTFTRFGKRTLTIPNVTLGIKPAWRLSITRAATAMALLVQLGISK